MLYATYSMQYAQYYQTWSRLYLSQNTKMATWWCHDRKSNHSIAHRKGFVMHVKSPTILIFHSFNFKLAIIHRIHSISWVKLGFSVCESGFVSFDFKHFYSKSSTSIKINIVQKRIHHSKFYLRVDWENTEFHIQLKLNNIKFCFIWELSFLWLFKDVLFNDLELLLFWLRQLEQFTNSRRLIFKKTKTVHPKNPKDSWNTQRTPTERKHVNFRKSLEYINGQKDK